jgi:prepilin signal peptidase PulO-like enzyme (type II secretory pathway)
VTQTLLLHIAIAAVLLAASMHPTSRRLVLRMARGRFGLPHRKPGLAPVFPRTTVLGSLALAFGLPFLFFLGSVPYFGLPQTELLLVTPALGSALLVLAIHDAAEYRLPDRLTLPIIGLGLASTALQGTILEAVLGAVIWGGLPLLLSALHGRLRGGSGLGFGDVKLMAAMGVWLGWAGAAFAIAGSTIAALGYALVIHAAGLQRSEGRLRIPLGIFLASGFWIAVLIKYSLLPV